MVDVFFTNQDGKLVRCRYKFLNINIFQRNIFQDIIKETRGFISFFRKAKSNGAEPKLLKNQLFAGKNLFYQMDG